MNADSIPSLGAPLRLVLDLTSRCNLRCAYCCFFSNPDECGRSDMPPARWVELIEDAARCGVLQVTLRGGEALLSPAFDAVIDAVVRNRMRFALLSNGKILDDAVAARLAATGRCDMVKISLDGREEIHDRMRGKGAHAGAMAGIAAARRAGLKVLATCAVHRYNFRMIPELIAYFADELGLKNFSFSAVSDCDAPDIAMTEADFHEAMHILNEVVRPDMPRRGMAGGVDRWRRLLNGETECPDCMLLRSRMSVLADGTMVPCPTFTAAVLGHCGRDSVADAWRKMRSTPEFWMCRPPDASCATCPFAGKCHGLCPAVQSASIGRSWRNFCLRRHLELYGGKL